jgi:hypothetical protein
VIQIVALNQHKESAVIATKDSPSPPSTPSRALSKIFAGFSLGAIFSFFHLLFHNKQLVLSRLFTDEGKFYE